MNISAVGWASAQVYDVIILSSFVVAAAGVGGGHPLVLLVGGQEGGLILMSLTAWLRQVGLGGGP